MMLFVGFSLRAEEQSLSDSKEDLYKHWNPSGVFAELTAGVALLDIATDFDAGFALGCRTYLGKGFSWEICKLQYFNPAITKHASQGSSFRALSTMRYTLLPIPGGCPFYVAAGAGFQVNFSVADTWQGFAYEAGLGVLVTPKVSLGLVWEGNFAHYKFMKIPFTDHYGVAGLKCSYLF